MINRMESPNYYISKYFIHLLFVSVIVKYINTVAYNCNLLSYMPQVKDEDRFYKAFYFTSKIYKN